MSKIIPAKVGTVCFLNPLLDVALEHFTERAPHIMMDFFHFFDDPESDINGLYLFLCAELDSADRRLQGDS